ncbi:MAG TPA: PIG-L family deacetylase, partial [Myxococcota bacterium]|nr:PIG-L family deacetylase [Myxococcota bacterium]
MSLSLALAMTTSVPALADPAPPVHPVRLDPLRPALHMGELTLAVKRLSVVGSVLYVAAHPDDENTRLLSWLVGERGLLASYVSLTRGDGGQNLIGEELGPLLGLIRTHELLAARRIDGATQYFTRAVDFGYSKTADETMRLWDGSEQDAVLSDLVRVVRLTRPDVIVTRFSTTPPNHGHHIASAMLARVAFGAAADPDRFPRQREDGVEVHAATRLFENKSHWRFKEGEDLSKYHQLDVGAFSPLLGRSFAELAAASRTMHKSQGFGSAPTHGPQPEYFELVESRDGGPSAVGDPLAGLDFTWRRFPGTEKVIKALA